MHTRTIVPISLKLFLSCVMCAFAVSGCLSLSELAKIGTTYHDSNNEWKLGYSDTQLNDSVYRVSYAGYSIPQSLCDDFALMRAAEITKKKGLRYFRLLDEKQSSSSQFFSLPGTTSTTGTVSRSGNVNATSFSSGMGVTMNYPVTTFTIEMRNDTDASLSSMDANIIWDSLSAKHLVVRK